MQENTQPPEESSEQPVTNWLVVDAEIYTLAKQRTRVIAGNSYGIGWAAPLMGLAEATTQLPSTERRFVRFDPQEGTGFWIAHIPGRAEFSLVNHLVLHHLLCQGAASGCPILETGPQVTMLCMWNLQKRTCFVEFSQNNPAIEAEWFSPFRPHLYNPKHPNTDAPTTGSENAGGDPPAAPSDSSPG